LRVRVRVFGLVQGVGFRDFVLRLADSSQLDGWVRNMNDGSVEAVLDGDARDIDRAIEMCRRGPPLAAVERCEVEEESDSEPITGFRVTY
jgi:acylphosphatase